MTSLFKTIMLVDKDGRQKPVALCVGFVVGLSATSLAAQTVRGVTATEIKIGQTMPYRRARVRIRCARQG
jgi:hypothetical protein